MSKVFALIAAAGILLGASGPKNASVRQSAAVISAATAAASRSFSVTQNPQLGVWGLWTVYISFTDADNSESLVTMTCTGSPDDNVTDYTLQSCTTASGVCTSSDASWTKNPGANTTSWIWRVDVEGIEDTECTFAFAGGSASDTITVKVAGSVKGS